MRALVRLDSQIQDRMTNIMYSEMDIISVKDAKVRV